MSDITITLSHESAYYGMAAVLPHASKEAVTPILTGVKITRNHFITTDRYAIAQYLHTKGDVEEGSIVLPRVAVDWYLRQTPRTLGLHDASYLKVEFSEVSIAIRREGKPLTEFHFDPLVGNFPPVERLLSEWEPAESAPETPVKLSSAFLARFSTSAAKLQGSRADMSIQFGKPNLARGKSAPIHVTIGDQFVGLLQPKI